MSKVLHAFALCAVLSAAGIGFAAPLRVVGNALHDAHGNTIQPRGVNVPVYKSGYADDLDAVAAAIALTHTNMVRLEWWAVPPAGTTEYTIPNLDRAIQKFYDFGIIPLVELHDLTFQYGHDNVSGPNSDGNDRTLFANTITAFWTRSDVLAVLRKHQDHLVINLANEWGSSTYSDASPTTANFIQNYTDAVAAIRNAGIVAPLVIDAPKGFEYPFILDHGAALLATDPLHNTLLSVHAYWAASDPSFSASGLSAIVDAFAASGLPIVIGEASSNAYTTIPCDPILYPDLLAAANTKGIGYLFWAWYEDGQCGQAMNITVNADGVTRPTAPGFGYDALYHASFGIDTASPATRMADFSPIARGDLNGDGKSDLLWRNGSTGQIFRMFMNGPAIAAQGMAYTEPNTAWKVVSDADFNGDGVADLLWRNDVTGQVYLQLWNSSGVPASGGLVYTEPNAAWKIVHTPDLDGDGRADILWWNSTTGQVYAMLMNGTSIAAQGMLYTEPNTAWRIVQAGDFAGSGRKNQLLWRNIATGQVFLMTVSIAGSTFSQSGAMFYREPNTAWKIIAAADFNGDGRSDILWRNDSTGALFMMLMNGTTISSAIPFYTEPNLAWKVIAQGDYNGDGKADLLWRNDTTGQVYMMLMNGASIASQAMVYQEPNTAWKILGPWEYGQSTGGLQ